MSLSNDLISQFVKATDDTKTKKTETIAYGTIVVYEDVKYVRLDGSELLTPITATTDMINGERVTVMIKDHTAIVTGNIDSPSARWDDVSNLGKKVSEFEVIIADKVSVTQLEAEVARITALEAVNVTVTGKLEAAEGKINTLETDNITVKEKLTANEASIKSLEADKATITGKLEAAEADITTLKADNATISGKVSANEADIKSLKTDKLDAETAKITYATITNLDAANGKITNLESDNANIKKTLTANEGKITSLESDNVTIKETITANQGKISTLESDNVAIKEKLTVNDADIATLKTNKLDAETAKITYAKITDLEATNATITNLNTKYANIDFTNIGKAAMQYFYAQSGLIKDVVVGDQTITGELVGVTIKGELIEGGTVVADKLVIKGNDGLYYKLNTDGATTETEQTEYNSLDGKVITAKSIVATKIDVDDLVAFDATIGGFNITSDSLYSGVKESVDNATRGIYLDNTGQMAVGDAKNYIKYYKDADGNYHLDISAATIKLGSTGANVEDTINEATSKVDDLEERANSGEFKGEKGDKGDTGPQGEQGLQGEKGEKGDKGDTGPQGAQGLQGLQGDKGEQGIQGPKGETGPTGATGASGQNGKTSYFHIKYSSVAKPTTSSQMSETPSTYIGTYVDFTEADSTDPAKYTWSRFEGAQGAKGDQGIAGTNGSDGKTSYLHIAYATSSDGKTGFSVSESSGKTYIGQYTDFTQADSTEPTKYSWTKVKGETGATGAKGDKGDTGAKGDKGDKGDTGATGAQGKPGIDFSQGKALYSDPMFLEGTNNCTVYNNSSGGKVNATRSTKSSDNPMSGATHELVIKNTGVSSPGCGGILQLIVSRANAVFIRRIIAKIPAGRRLLYAQNDMGHDWKCEWLTDNNGTGKFKEYIYKYTCGASGTFNTGGHMYIDGSVGTADSPVTWYVAYCQTFDMTAKSDVVKAQETADSKTDPDKIIETINNTPETTKIKGEHINITGLVTFDSFDSSLQSRVNTIQSTANTAASNASNAQSVIGNWCYNNDKTVINGGKIYTGTIGASQIAANAITADKIAADAVTADKINVADLYAIGATIGGLHITSGTIYSGSKSSISNTSQGLFMDSSGQINIGNASNYIKFASGALDLKVNSLTIGTSDVASAITNASYWKYQDWVDASSYDESLWIPFVSSLAVPTNTNSYIEVVVALNSNTKPSWSTHDAGFSVNFLVETQGKGWGSNRVTPIILKDEKYCVTGSSPVSFKQNSEKSLPILYLRGGGKYYVRTTFAAGSWTGYPNGFTWTSGSYSGTYATSTTRPVPEGEPYGTKSQVDSAAKTATNYLKYDSSGLVIGNMTASTLGNNVLIDSDSVDIRKGTTVLASYGANTIYLGKNSQTTTINLCDNLATMSAGENVWSGSMLLIDTPDELRMTTSGRISSQVSYNQASAYINLQARDYDSYTEDSANIELIATNGGYTASIFLGDTSWGSTAGIIMTAMGNNIMYIGTGYGDLSDVTIDGSLCVTGLVNGVDLHDSGWQTASLTSTFTKYHSDGSNAPKYRKINNVVTVTGVVRPTTTLSASSQGSVYPIFTLPEGYRPVQQISTICQGSSNAVWQLLVYPNGNVCESRYRNNTATSFSDVASNYWLTFHFTFMTA